ncbi:MAG: hypothetical protein IJO87_02965, partial [Eggerthellaceae bacterium]|nr:hypothetical protein [Eggerthellaceae bacterium]
CGWSNVFHRGKPEEPRKPLFCLNLAEKLVRGDEAASEIHSIIRIAQAVTNKASVGRLCA